MLGAIIGVGEVGGCYARALATAAAFKLCDIKTDGPPARTAETIGVDLETRPGPWLQGAEFVLVCVPGKESPVVAASALPFIGPEAVYIDMATARPDDLRHWSKRFKDQGRAFVDAAIMGSIQLTAEKTPILLAGEKAGAARKLYAGLGARTDVVEDGAAGDATSLKLLRSILIKGLECLAVEALTAAEHMGVRPQLYGALKDVDAAAISDFLEMLVTTHIPHAERRGHEIVDAADQLREMGFDALVTGALPPRYEATIAAKTGNPPAEGVRPIAESLAWLKQTVRA